MFLRPRTEAVDFSKMSVFIYHTTWRHIPDSSNLLHYLMRTSNFTWKI